MPGTMHQELRILAGPTAAIATYAGKETAPYAIDAIDADDSHADIRRKTQQYRDAWVSRWLEDETTERSVSRG